MSIIKNIHIKLQNQINECGLISLKKYKNGETLEYLVFDLFEDIVNELKQHDKIKSE